MDASSKAVSAMSATSVSYSDFDGMVISANYFSTSGVKYTSAGDLPTSSVPASGNYNFSGSFIDDTKDFAWFTSATTLI